jgi:archaellin
MNHKNTTLAIAAIVAAVAMSAVAFAVPQQALAYGHHNHNNNSNSIKVSQDISQANVCSNSSVCLNTGDNSADIHR